MIRQYDGADYDGADLVQALQIFLIGKSKDKKFNTTNLTNKNECPNLQQTSTRYKHKDYESDNIALPVIKR